MRDLLVGVVALSSSVVFPPNPTPPHHFTKRSKSRTRPKPKPSSPAVPAPSRSSSSSVPSRPPLLSAVRWDLLAPRRRSHVKYYAGLASRLCEAGKLEEFLMVAETVLASGVEPSKFAGLLNAEALSAGFARALREGKVRSVVEVLSGVRGLGIRAVELFDSLATEALARECHRIVSCGEVEEVVDLMETLAGCHFSIKELVEPSDIIKVCVTRRNPDASVRYACIFPHVHVLFCNIIQEFGKKRDLLSALTVFKASKEKLNSPNMYIYRTIIDVCGLCGDHLQSRCIYEELLAQRITPNIYVFNSLMNVNAHDLSYTLYVYKHMQDLGVIPDMASYNILLKSCCFAARVDLAQDIYCEAQNMESTGALKLDVFTYSTIIKVFADAKLWQMALKVKEDMLSAGVTPNIVTWSSLISACANAGLIEQATQLFEEMVLAGCEPNSQCFNILLHACVEACQYDRAFRLFQSWKESGFQNMFSEDSNSRKDPLENSNTIMSNFRFNSHRLRFAMRVPFTPTTSTYNILMKACGTDYYRAKSLMDEMQTVGLSPNHISWSILIDVCGGLGNTEGAMLILRSMQETGIQPDVVAYTTAIKVCVESKNLKIAFSLYSEMKRYQIQPNLVTYNTLLRARCRYGSLQEVQQCLAIYQDMRKAGYKSNDYYLKQLIEEWCEGVIQDSNQKKSPSSFCNIADIGKPQSLLLEKVAAHLQTSNTESLAIDLQGLTKVEARIVVLAVLRMIKEKHTPGDSINDDMSIIIGPSTAKNESEVEDAIIKLLQNDLGLEVLLTGPRIALLQKMNLRNPFDSYPSLEDIMGRSELPGMLKSSTRRPVVLHRLKVTRKSLYNWLRRTTGASRR